MKTARHKAFYQSPIGTIEAIGSDKGISSLNFIEDTNQEINVVIPECLQDCIKQLNEYFKKNRKEFSLTFDFEGTDFQKIVWKELLKIPFGKTVSYLDIAKAIGDKNSTRAVGNANGKNKIVIVIPCHRVIGASGNLTGYAGGMKRKKWLLDFENNNLQGNLFNESPELNLINSNKI